MKLLRRAFLLAVIIGLAGFHLGVRAPAHASVELPGCSSATDWPMFGHDPGRSFSSPDTCIGTVGAATLRPKWFFNTSAPVTAQPTVVGNTVYVGDFAGKFHALDATAGIEKWSFDIHKYDNDHVDYSAIDDSAVFTTIQDHDSKVHHYIVFGGGATLFVLDADNRGALKSSLCLDRVDTTCQGRTGYTTEIESSPVVVPSNANGAADILTGTDVNEHDPTGPTGLYDITLSPDGSLTPKWQFEPETGITTSGLPPAQTAPGNEHGCGDVWSSPTIVGSLVVFGTGNCNQPNEVTSTTTKHVESTFALHLSDGSLAWQATPHAPYTCDAKGNCSGFDLDFGATPNALPAATGATVGEGGKDGVYYAYDSAGHQIWKTAVATPSDIGGMIGTPAVGRLGALHGNHAAIFATTAIPIADNNVQASIQNDLTHPNQAFGVHAIDAVTHQVVWDAPLPPSYGAAVYDNGVVYVPDTVSDSLVALDADTGLVLRVQPLDAPPASPVAISGGSLYMGAGTTENGKSLLSDPTALLTDPQGTAFGTLNGFGGVWGFQTTP